MAQISSPLNSISILFHLSVITLHSTYQFAKKSFKIRRSKAKQTQPAVALRITKPKAK